MPSDDSITTERLIQEIQEMTGERCPHCDQPVNLSDALKSRALGSRRRPKCLAGLAEFIGCPIEDLERQLTDYYDQRDCYRGAQEWIDSR